MSKQHYSNWYVRGLQTMVAAAEASEKVAAENAGAATGLKLKAMLKDGSKIAGKQTGMIKDLLQQAGGTPGGESDRVLEAIIQSGRADIASANNPDVADAAVIATTQVGLHYYIAAYGTLAATAKYLGMDDQATTMSDMIDHMKSKDADYSSLADEMLASQSELAG